MYSKQRSQEKLIKTSMGEKNQIGYYRNRKVESIEGMKWGMNGAGEREGDRMDVARMVVECEGGVFCSKRYVSIREATGNKRLWGLLLRQAIHCGSVELQEKAELRLLEWKSEDGRKMNVGRGWGRGGRRWATIRGRLIVHDVLLLYHNKVPDQSHHGETCLTISSRAERGCPLTLWWYYEKLSLTSAWDSVFLFTVCTLRGY